MASSDFNPRSPHGERLRGTVYSVSPSCISIHAPRTGSDKRAIFKRRALSISIHAPRTGSDVSKCQMLINPLISIHAPRTGSDTITNFQKSLDVKFQSTLPARGATAGVFRQCSIRPAHFNPRSPHGERRSIYADVIPTENISIHAPRTGSDTRMRYLEGRSVRISIHAPRTGSDRSAALNALTKTAFQSTLPARGATRRSGGKTAWSNNFNPRSPHGERLRKVTILSIRIIDFAQKVYHKTVLLRISLAENAVILPEKPRNPVRTSLQKAGGLRFARAIRAAHPYSISSPSGA